MFKGQAPGYTIVEVLVFLAVSGVIFVAAVLLFQGQQGKTQFDQSMRDLNSKVEQYVNDVNGGFFPGSDKYGCSVGAGSRPVLNNNPSGLGANQSCIFLGKAIGVTAGGNSLKVYTVLGDRLDPTTQSPVTTLASAYAEPANQPGFDLTETYSILWGATVKSSQFTPSSGGRAIDGDLVGFYSDLQGNTTTGGAQAVAAYGYPAPDLNNVSCYIEGTATAAPTCSYYLMQSWQLCLQSGSSSRTALLQINSSSLGVTTKLTFGGC